MNCDHTEIESSERKKKHEEFRDKLEDFLMEHLPNMDGEDMIICLIRSARIIACGCFDWYLHMLGFMTLHLTASLPNQFMDIRKEVEKEREKNNASHPL